MVRVEASPPPAATQVPRQVKSALDYKRTQAQARKPSRWVLVFVNGALTWVIATFYPRPSIFGLTVDGIGALVTLAFVLLGHGLLFLFGLNTLWHLYNVLKAKFFVPADVAALTSDQKKLLGMNDIPQGNGTGAFGGNDTAFSTSFQATPLTAPAKRLPPSTRVPTSPAAAPVAPTSPSSSPGRTESGNTPQRQLSRFRVPPQDQKSLTSLKEFPIQRTSTLNESSRAPDFNDSLFGSSMLSSASPPSGIGLGAPAGYGYPQGVAPAQMYGQGAFGAAPAYPAPVYGGGMGAPASTAGFGNASMLNTSGGYGLGLNTSGSAYGGAGGGSGAYGGGAYGGGFTTSPAAMSNGYPSPMSPGSPYGGYASPPSASMSMAAGSFSQGGSPRMVYQRATPPMVAAKRHEAEDAVVPPHRTLERIGSTVNIDLSIDNAFDWMRHVILRPLVHQIDRNNIDLKSQNMEIGDTSYSELEAMAQKLAAGDDTSGKYPKLQQVIPYLSLAPENQRYYVQRIRDLADFAGYKWDGGGSIFDEQGREQRWAAPLPTDADILFHCFCKYMDDPSTLYRRRPNDFIFGAHRTFTELHVIQGSKGPSEILKRKERTNSYFHKTADKNQKAHFRLIFAEPAKNEGDPPKYEIYDLPSGRNNLFLAIVGFLWYVRDRDGGKLDVHAETELKYLASNIIRILA